MSEMQMVLLGQFETNLIDYTMMVICQTILLMMLIDIIDYPDDNGIDNKLAQSLNKTKKISFQIWEPGHLCPLSILLTTSGSRGYKLLYQYPNSKQKSLTDSFNSLSDTFTGNLHKKSRSSSSLEVFSPQVTEDGGVRTSTNQDIIDASINSLKPTSYIENEKLSSYLKEDSLVSLLAARNICLKEKFYLKMEDVIFVGNLCGSTKFIIDTINDAQTIKTFNVVFALRSTAPKTVQDSFYILAKSITSALCMEEKRCGFISEERSIIQNLSDDLQEQVDDGEDPADLLLKKSQLCRDLKQIVDDVSKTGVVFSTINNMVTLCHCIPQRIYHVIDNVYINSSTVMYAANNIKPYHTLIFLTSKEDIINSLPFSNPDFRKFLIQISFKDTIFATSFKCCLPLNFCLKMAANLVLWGKAIICYQIQDSNMYWIAPFIDTCLSSDLLDDFHNNFPSLFLPRVFGQINTYQPYADVLRNMGVDDDTGVQLIEWLMYHRLIYQTHKYYILIQCDPRNCIDFSKIKAASLKSRSADDETSNLLNQLLNEYSENFGLESTFDNDSIRLFSRISPLCNGEHHLEDITFQVNEPRTEVVRCLELFSKHLITVENADPITSCFVGVN